MTIAELYFYAKAHGAEHAKIMINYECKDDWYNYHDELEKKEVEITSKKLVTITISN